MKRLNVTFGRPANSRRAIVQTLRSEIVSGEAAPGSRLPTHVEIERRFNAGPTTVQRALELLRRDGFIVSKGRQGTFVVENPPHLGRYAVVFFSASSAFAHNRYSAALDSEVRRLKHQRSGLQIAEYYGVDGHEDSEDYQRLVREIRSQRIAGLIFTSKPHLVRGTPVLDEPGMPRVAIMPPTEEIAVPAIYLCMESFFTKALDDLRRCGRQRVAFLNPPGFCSWQERIGSSLREHGLETRPFWWQCVSPDSAEAARYITHLLMRCEERPNALVVSNDNLLEYATAGLVAAGARVPEDIVVISHCNFPYPTPSVVPVRRLGFDARSVLGLCIESINQQRAGEVVPQVREMEAIFEAELAG